MKLLKGDILTTTARNITDRMRLLGITTEDLANLSLLDEKEIAKILESRLSLEDMDQYHLALLSSVLHCDVDYWRDDEVRRKDLLFQAMSSEIDDDQSIRVRARLQDFLNDFAFVCEVLHEENESVYAQTVHDQAVHDAVREAGKVFAIGENPGNLFETLDFSEIIWRHQLLVFRENIGSLTGFTGYGANNVSLICVNCNMSAEKQNFVLAHELGHWMMYYGKGMFDGDGMFGDPSDRLEIEANDFACELLCHSTFREKDFHGVKDANSDYHKRLIVPYRELYGMVDNLASRGIIGIAMAESVKYKNRDILQ